MPDINKSELQDKVEKAQQELNDCAKLLLTVRAQVGKRIQVLENQVKAREQESAGAENIPNFNPN